MDPDKIMDGISREILAALKAMKKAKTPGHIIMILLNREITVNAGNDGKYSLNAGLFDFSDCRVKIEIDEKDCTPPEWQNSISPSST